MMFMWTKASEIRRALKQLGAPVPPPGEDIDRWAADLWWSMAGENRDAIICKQCASGLAWYTMLCPFGDIEHAWFIGSGMRVAGAVVAGLFEWSDSPDMWPKYGRYPFTRRV